MLAVKNGDATEKILHIKFVHEKDGWHRSDGVYEFKNKFSGK